MQTEEWLQEIDGESETERPENTARVYWTFRKMLDIGKYFRTYCYQPVLDMGFSLNEIDVLMSLTQHPEKNTVKGISETVHLSKGMISQAVESLRRKKFVSVHHDARDRRSLLIRLNSVAMPVLERLMEASEAFVQTIIHGIPAELLQEGHEIVTRVYANKEQMKTKKNASKKQIGGAAKAATAEDGCS